VPRFYFHFYASGFSADDRTGRELASLAAAHRHAVCVVDQATRYFEEAHDWSRWTVRIAMKREACSSPCCSAPV
jgi:hypothetical protein